MLCFCAVLNHARAPPLTSLPSNSVPRAWPPKRRVNLLSFARARTFRRTDAPSPPTRTLLVAHRVHLPQTAPSARPAGVRDAGAGSWTRYADDSKPLGDATSERAIVERVAVHEFTRKHTTCARMTRRAERRCRHCARAQGEGTFGIVAWPCPGYTAYVACL